MKHEEGVVEGKEEGKENEEWSSGEDEEREMGKGGKGKE